MPADSFPSLAPPPAPDPARTSLFIDFDGTLVDLVERPDAVQVDEALGDLLTVLAAALPGRVALVSGRSLAQLDGFLGGAIGDLSVAGSHGVERRLGSGVPHAPARPATLDVVERTLAAFAAEHPGVLVEPKSHGVALHYRLAPDRADAAHGVMASLAAEHGLALQPGKMMIELRSGAADKGDAVRAFMADAPMAGTRPIMLGDDLTDEPAFVAAAELGGGGILVGASRATAALWRLDGVAAVRAWLAGVTA